MIFCRIDADAVQPCINRAFPAKPGQRPVCLDKSILCDILGLRRVTHKAGNKPPESALVLRYQQIKGELVTALDALNQLLIHFPVCHPRLSHDYIGYAFFSAAASITSKWEVGSGKWETLLPPPSSRYKSKH